MNLPAAFQEYIKKENLFSPTDRLLLAVSGGVDSVVLCYLCKESGYDFSIAHCNFGLRGAESEGDELFVSGLAARLDVPIHIRKFDTSEYASKNRLSIQVAARELRYEWFNDLSDATESNYILTAHHSDDNIETMLMNFFKGTGLNGLKGILPKNGRVIRPLLFATKEIIRDYAVEYNLDFREDSSNSSDKYTRNYFRNELIPGIEKVFPQVKENLQENLLRFREIHAVYQAAVDVIKKSLLERKGNEVLIPVLKISKTPGYKSVLFEILSDFHFTPGQLKDALKLLHADSGKYIVSSTHRILRNRKWLIISPITVTDTSIFVLDNLETDLVFPAGVLSFVTCKKPATISPDPFDIQVNAAGIKLPLLVRKWKQGDYFYPLGMQKKKKLSRFLIDQKRSLSEKENTWVVESDKRIIWIVGQRIDDRFKVNDQSDEVLNIRFLPA
jgi:tRNA(Ile)-lysidine synthase